MIITRASGAYVTGYQLELANAVSIVNLEGDVLGADPLFLQIHNTVGAPANAAVPIRSLRVVAQNGFRWYHAPELMDLPKAGIYIVLSTTEATFTATATTMNLFIDIEDYGGLAKMRSDINTAGDLVSNTVLQVIWSEAAGFANPKKIYKLQVSEAGAVNSYVQIFGVDAPVAGVVPIMQWPLPASTTLTLNFGDAAKAFLPTTAAGVRQTGFTVVISLTPNSYDAAGLGTIKGWYHNIA